LKNLFSPQLGFSPRTTGPVHVSLQHLFSPVLKTALNWTGLTICSFPPPLFSVSKPRRCSLPPVFFLVSGRVMPHFSPSSLSVPCARGIYTFALLSFLTVTTQDAYGCLARRISSLQVLDFFGLALDSRDFSLFPV